ncbi:hypothetical protein BDV3_005500 [Batrachochytrium dendrobatidis]
MDQPAEIDLQILANIGLFLRNIGMCEESFSEAFRLNPQHTAQELHRLVQKIQELATNLIPKESETSSLELEAEMASFLKSQQEFVNTSNKDEFLVSKKTGAARVDALKIDRETQMKRNVVHNFAGPLERSTLGQSAENMNMADLDASRISTAMNERIGLLETHLGLCTGPSAETSQRLKRLEDRICQIEDCFPSFAAFKFNQQHTSILPKRNVPEDVIVPLKKESTTQANQQAVAEFVSI